MAALGLKLGQIVTKEDLRYGKILIYTDADTDGSSICALLINFFYKFWPELFDMNMIYKVETPILVCHNIKTKKKILFYTEDSYIEWYNKVNTKDWDMKYKKGLAALFDDEYQEIVTNPVLTLIKRDDLCDEYLNIWFGKDPELRKNQLIINNIL